MHRPTDNLRADHRVVRRGTAVLAAIANHVQRGGTFPGDDWATLLQFLRDFLVGVHFRKESDVVFPAAAMRGDEHVASLVGDLTRLQEEAIELVQSLALFSEANGDVGAGERSAFVEAVSALRSRLRRMEPTEELEVFPACDRSVPADDQLDWSAAFAAVESERTGREAWAERIAVLAKHWLPV
jgi:hemerythrin-like domain-containing protein